ncbi:MAG: uroporphyrinogen-III synthase [Bacteroidales bacterium]|nr:uroporphyrinogen-III synthase [Bacteroidales bacterium]
MNIKKILVSQNAPRVLTQYQQVSEKYGVNFEFRPFFKIEPLTSREFRAQRINFLDYTAVVFSSRHVIDAYFTLAEELRTKIPETMKYFCTTEAVAMYLQKHIVYRKRKIFYGTGTPESVISLIGPKHKGEKFLIAMSDITQAEAITAQFEANHLQFATGVFVKSVSQDLKDVDLHAYDMIVFYNPADVKSLNENFPDFRQGDIKMVSYGRSIVRAMEEAGLRIDVKAPSPEAPSVASAIERYLKSLQ